MNVLWLTLCMGLAVGCTSEDEKTAFDTANVLFEGDEAGECSDEADNDGDGLFDCNDPGCSGSPECTDEGELDGTPDDGDDGGTTDGGSGGTDGGSGGTDGGSGGTTDGGSDGTTDGGSDGTTDGGSDGTTDGGSDGATDGATDGGSDGGPTACDGPEDCSGEDCPTDAIGCTCSETDGTGFCVPTCETDDDCSDIWICDPVTSTCRSGGDVDSDTPTDGEEDADIGIGVDVDEGEDLDAGDDADVTGPSPCTVDEDCADTCPSDADCVCAGGDDASFCVPTCDTDDDCDGSATCDLTTSTCDLVGAPDTPPDEGLPADEGPVDSDGATPDGDGGSPASCSSDDDCTATCPPEMAFCVCSETGGDSVCVPGCSTDADCDGDATCDSTTSTCSGGLGPAPDGGTPPDEAADEAPDADGGILSDCETDDDCTLDDCPIDSTACVCLPGFEEGESGSCVSGCETDEDCFGDLVCLDGLAICGPEGSIGDEPPLDSDMDSGGGLTDCASDLDCTSEDCPPWAVGCACLDFLGSCVPACETDADCPSSCVTALGVCAEE